MSNVHEGVVARVIDGPGKGAICTVLEQSVYYTVAFRKLFWEVVLHTPANGTDPISRRAVPMDSGAKACVADDILRPIDDPDADAITRETELEVEA